MIEQEGDRSEAVRGLETDDGSEMDLIELRILAGDETGDFNVVGGCLSGMGGRQQGRDGKVILSELLREEFGHRMLLVLQRAGVILSESPEIAEEAEGVEVR